LSTFIALRFQEIEQEIRDLEELKRLASNPKTFELMRLLVGREPAPNIRAARGQQRSSRSIVAYYPISAFSRKISVPACHANSSSGICVKCIFTANFS